MSDLAIPPPTYSGLNDDDINSNVEVQMLICPYTDFQFQKGYLGVEGERATIEGEIQLKGVHPDLWESLYVPNLMFNNHFEAYFVTTEHCP